MTLYDRRKEKLITDLRDKEYRNAFVSEYIYTGIPFQIKALREQRKWRQEDLGQQANMHQERISVLESPGNERLNIKTLLRLASAFNIGLVVRFVPISDLMEWELNLSPESLRVPSFNEEPCFQEETEETAIRRDSIEWFKVIITEE
jgi:transcriptional regulator with XRE-family HTH domain